MRVNSNTKQLTPGSAEWRSVVTGSKIAPILGISPYQSPARLWLEMRNDIAPEPETDAMRRGTIQEDSILDWFFQVIRPDIRKVAGETTFTRTDLPWAAANPDAVADENGQTVFIEAKSVARDGGEWGKPGTDQVPLHYYTQVVWAMHMTQHPEAKRVNRCYIVKHGPYVDQYDTYTVEYDPQVAKVIEQRAHAFHQSLTDDDAMPPAVEMAGEHKVFAKIHPDIEPDLDWEIHPDLAAAYITAREDVKDAQARESKVKADILRAMGTARTAVCNGVTVAYRRATKTGVSLYPPQRTVTLDDITPQAHAA